MNYIHNREKVMGCLEIRDNIKDIMLKGMVIVPDIVVKERKGNVITKCEILSFCLVSDCRCLNKLYNKKKQMRKEKNTEKVYGKFKAIVRGTLQDSEMWIEDGDGNKIYIPCTSLEISQTSDDFSRATVGIHCDRVDIDISVNDNEKITKSFGDIDPEEHSDGIIDLNDA